MDAAISVARSGAGLTMTVRMCHVYAFSTLQFVASFFKPPHSVIKLEKKMMNILGNGPFAAFPREVLTNLKQIKISVQLRDISIASLAARVRNGIEACPQAATLAEQANSSMMSDEAILT